jgi:hypothetical protein
MVFLNASSTLKIPPNSSILYPMIKSYRRLASPKGSTLSKKRPRYKAFLSIQTVFSLRAVQLEINICKSWVGFSKQELERRAANYANLRIEHAHLMLDNIELEMRRWGSLSESVRARSEAQEFKRKYEALKTENDQLLQSVFYLFFCVFLSACIHIILVLSLTHDPFFLPVIDIFIGLDNLLKKIDESKNFSRRFPDSQGRTKDMKERPKFNHLSTCPKAWNALLQLKGEHHFVLT